MLIHYVLLYVVAVFAGLLGSIIGIGGGIIIVPVLSLWLNVPIQYAIAASLISVIATSIAGAHSYVEQNITNVRLGMFLEVSTTSGALAGALLAVILHGWILSIIFGTLVLSMALFSFATRSRDDRISFVKDESAEGKKLENLLNIEGSYYDKALDKDVHYWVRNPLGGSFLALLAGLGSGLLGIGGGVVKVTAMNAMMRVPMKVSVATSKFMIGVTAATSSIIYLISGSFIVAPVALGTMTGATIGSSVMNHFKSKSIKIVFTLVTAYLSYKMIAAGLKQGFDISLF